VNIALISESDRIGDADLYFMAAACSAQAEEFCRAYGIAPILVSAYSRGTKLPPETTHVATIKDTLGVPGALGFHDVSGPVEYIEIEAQDVTSTGVTASHEVLELLGDPTCDKWAPWRDGKQQAREVADRVEGDNYVETVTVLGETRPVNVSNYLLPAAFEAGSAGPWDRMNRLTSWDGLTPGGYVIVQDAAGNVANVFAEKGAMPSSFARKLVNPLSRTLRRLRNPPRPSITSPEGETQ
jgi:hypothetical protein